MVWATESMERTNLFLFCAAGLRSWRLRGLREVFVSMMGASSLLGCFVLAEIAGEVAEDGWSFCAVAASGHNAQRAIRPGSTTSWEFDRWLRQASAGGPKEILGET